MGPVLPWWIREWSNDSSLFRFVLSSFTFFAFTLGVRELAFPRSAAYGKPGGMGFISCFQISDPGIWNRGARLLNPPLQRVCLDAADVWAGQMTNFFSKKRACFSGWCAHAERTRLILISSDFILMNINKRYKPKSKISASTAMQIKCFFTAGENLNCSPININHLDHNFCETWKIIPAIVWNSW